MYYTSAADIVILYFHDIGIFKGIRTGYNLNVGIANAQS